MIVRTRIGEYVVEEGLLYTDSDEWIRLTGDVAVVGVTDYAQKKLRHVVSVELPEPGRELRRGEVAATLESVKAIADVYAPVDGVVVEVNEELRGSPDLINKDPYGRGWILKIRPSGSLPTLMGPEEYAEYIRRRE